MRAVLVATALFAPASLVATAQSAMRVGSLTVSPPTLVATLEMNKLKGQPSRLAWSPDGSQLYLQTLEGSFADAANGRPGTKLRHYAFAPTSGAARKDLGEEPAWVSAYWIAKYGQHAPGAPALKIQLTTETRQQKATSTPMGGDLAKGGVEGNPTAGSSAGDVGAAAYSTQHVTVHTMSYKGHKVGEFENTVIVPGLTYGWGPEGTNVIAFATVKSGKIVVLDDQGERLEIDSSQDGLLPAWSPDGKRLAWLQRDGRKKFQLHVANVSVKTSRSSSNGQAALAR